MLFLRHQDDGGGHQDGAHGHARRKVNPPTHIGPLWAERFPFVYSCMTSRVYACEERPYQGVQLNRELCERQEVHAAIMLSAVPFLAIHHDSSGPSAVRYRISSCHISSRLIFVETAEDC